MTESKVRISGKVLIVDDNPKNLQVLGSALRTSNYEVEFSTDGMGAIEWLRNEAFDLVLLDVMMPELDGFETCRRIRKDRKADDLPIIFLTAKTDRESILKGFKVGAQDYITKPFDADELLARVGTNIALKKMRQELADINEHLESKVIERTRQLDEANKELSVLDTIKVEFLNMLSHEIRTPLNGIKGSLQLLKVRIDNEDLIQLIDILDLSVERLENFSYTALLITRLNSKKYRIDKSLINVKEELDFSLLPLNNELSQKGLKMNVGNNLEAAFIYTDKTMLHEIFKRIFDNAIKYSPDDTTVHVNYRDGDKYCYINIQDEGNGFPDKILNSRLKLFNPGEHHVNRNMGLNLYLSNLIMEYLGGKFEIGNSEEGGAFVSLAFKKDEPEPEAEEVKTKKTFLTE